MKRAKNDRNDSDRQSLFSESEWLRRADESVEEWDARSAKMIEEIEKTGRSSDAYLETGKFGHKKKQYL